VFSLAIKYPLTFRLLSYWQVFLVKCAPRLLFKMLFSTAAGKDKAMVYNQEFKQHISAVLKNCFDNNTNGYIREINLYVQPWEVSIRACTVESYLWHGASDNWSPVGMASYFEKTIPNCKSVTIFDGMSHYSSLYESIPRICQQLTKV